MEPPTITPIRGENRNGGQLSVKFTKVINYNQCHEIKKIILFTSFFDSDTHDSQNIFIFPKQNKKYVSTFWVF